MEMDVVDKIVIATEEEQKRIEMCEETGRKGNWSSLYCCSPACVFLELKSQFVI